MTLNLVGQQEEMEVEMEIVKSGGQEVFEDLQ